MGDALETRHRQSEKTERCQGVAGAGRRSPLSCPESNLWQGASFAVWDSGD